MRSGNWIPRHLTIFCRPCRGKVRIHHLLRGVHFAVLYVYSHENITVYRSRSYNLILPECGQLNILLSSTQGSVVIVKSLVPRLFVNSSSVLAGHSFFLSLVVSFLYHAQDVCCPISSDGDELLYLFHFYSRNNQVNFRKYLLYLIMVKWI